MKREAITKTILSLALGLTITTLKQNDINANTILDEDLNVNIVKASNPWKEMNLIFPGVAKNGVYAVAPNGNLIANINALSDELKKQAVGVALITNNQRIVIEKNEKYDAENMTFYWGKSLYQKDVIKITEEENSILIKTDFNGKANTAAIIAAYAELGVEMNSQDMCKVLQDFNAEEQAAGRTGDWYIPALGQFYEIYNNRIEINKLLSLIKGEKLSPANSYWSSSEYKKNYGWCMNFRYCCVNFEFKRNLSPIRLVRDL